MYLESFDFITASRIRFLLSSISLQPLQTRLSMDTLKKAESCTIVETEGRWQPYFADRKLM